MGVFKCFPSLVTTGCLFLIIPVLPSLLTGAGSHTMSFFFNPYIFNSAAEFPLMWRHLYCTYRECSVTNPVLLLPFGFATFRFLCLGQRPGSLPMVKVVAT